MSFSPVIVVPLHQLCFVFPSICLVRTYTLMTFRTLSHAMVRITGDIYADVGGSVIDGRHVFELDGCEVDEIDGGFTLLRGKGGGG